MMRCCKHCGALLEDEAKVCEFCGAVLEMPAPVEPAPQPVETAVATDAPSTPTPKKKIPKKKWFIIGGIVTAVIALVLGAYLLFFNPHIAVDRYETVMNGEFDKLESLAPKEYWTYCAKNSGAQSVEAYIAQRKKVMEKTFLQSQSEDNGYYGKLKSITYKVLDTEKVPKSDIKGIKEALDEHYGIDPASVQDAYNMVIKVTYHGTTREYSTSAYVTAIRIGSNWYLMRYSAYQNKYSVSFIGENSYLY